MRKAQPPAIGAALLALVLLSGCSHTTPYYRPDVLTPHRQGPPNEGLVYRILLIGDAGEPQPGEAVLGALESWAGRDPEKTLTVFLGDNVYPKGLTGQDFVDGRKRLDPQLAAVVNARSRGLFIPGNHDWYGKGEGGLDAILRQQAYVEQRLLNPDPFLPKDGCPGPEILDLPVDDPVVRVVAINTQWWLGHERRVGPTCAGVTERDVLRRLSDAMKTSLPVVVVGHHPLESHGPHGGFFDWQDHLFPLTRISPNAWIPLPGIGSLYPLFMLSAPHSQNLGSGTYRNMIRQLSQSMSRGGKQPLVYAAGHDHSLQVFEGNPGADYVLVSGSGSKIKGTPVHHGDSTLFSHQHPGFMALDFFATGDIWLRVLEPDRRCWPEGTCQVFTRKLGRVPRKSNP